MGCTARDILSVVLPNLRSRLDWTRRYLRAWQGAGAYDETESEATLLPRMLADIPIPAPLLPSRSIHCSPDHYVTLVFEGHTFVDQNGKRNVRSGRECVAQQALDFFFGTRDGGDDTSTKTNANEEERGSPTQLQAATSGICALSIDETKAPSPPRAAVAATATTPPERECANPVGYLYEIASRWHCAPPVFIYETKKG